MLYKEISTGLRSKEQRKHSSLLALMQREAKSDKYDQYHDKVQISPSVTISDT